MNLAFWLTITVIIGILYLTHKYIFELLIVSGLSMLPTYKGGELVLIKKSFLKLESGDIVVVKPKGYPLAIKRIVAIKGDLVFVQGDNTQNSIDSRTYGWLNLKNIEGKVIKSWETK